MENKSLKQFFRENSVSSETPTAQALAHFYLMIENTPEINEKFETTVNETIFKVQSGREEKMLAERAEIITAVTSEQIVRIMRRHTDPMNRSVLVDKALDNENEIVPIIINMLKTSLNDGFIETSIRVLAKSVLNVAEELIVCFDDIHNPYAKSMALVLLGYKAGEEFIPWFIEKYNELKRLYPNESYCEGAYYALIEIENRFYNRKGLKQ